MDASFVPASSIEASPAPGPSGGGAPWSAEPSPEGVTSDERLTSPEAFASAEKPASDAEPASGEEPSSVPDVASTETEPSGDGAPGDGPPESPATWTMVQPTAKAAVSPTVTTERSMMEALMAASFSS